MAEVVRGDGRPGVDVVVETVGIGGQDGFPGRGDRPGEGHRSASWGPTPQNRAEFPVTTFKEKEMTMMGSRGIPFDALDRALMLLSQGRVDLNPVITHRFPLSQIHEAIRVSEHEKASAMKVMITY